MCQLLLWKTDDTNFIRLNFEQFYNLEKENKVKIWKTGKKRKKKKCTNNDDWSVDVLYPIQENSQENKFFVN